MRTRFLLALWVAVVAFAGKPAASVDDGVDRLALAARLLADGYADRAERALTEVDAATPGLDLARYHTLRGLAAAAQGDHARAVEAWRLAVAQPGADPLVHVQLAGSLLTLGQPAEALVELDHAGDAANALAATWRLRARAAEAAGDVSIAWVALARGLQRFPDDLDLARQRVAVLVRLGLFLEAGEAGRALLARTPDDPLGWLALATSLREGGDARGALLLLEEAHLRFPDRPEVGAQLARAHLAAGNARAAGELLAVAGERDPALLAAAAECFRQAGDVPRALWLNGRVPDPVEKAKQRLGLLLAAEAWGAATALAPRLERLGLTADDTVRYGLAYAWFRLGDFTQAERWLRGIASARAFRDATALREAMARCAEEGGCF